MMEPRYVRQEVGGATESDGAKVCQAGIGGATESDGAKVCQAGGGWG